MSAFAGSWPTSFQGGAFSLNAELSTSAPFARPARRGRNIERTAVDLPAGLRQRGASGVAVQIVDLSPEGFRAATHLDLTTGTDVWLRLPGLEPCHARVAWSEGLYIGCAFVRPLHPAVFDMIVTRSSPR